MFDRECCEGVKKEDNRCTLLIFFASERMFNDFAMKTDSENVVLSSRAESISYFTGVSFSFLVKSYILFHKGSVSKAIVEGLDCLKLLSKASKYAERDSSLDFSSKTSHCFVQYRLFQVNFFVVLYIEVFL